MKMREKNPVCVYTFKIPDFGVFIFCIYNIITILFNVYNLTVQKNICIRSSPDKKKFYLIHFNTMGNPHKSVEHILLSHSI